MQSERGTRPTVDRRNCPTCGAAESLLRVEHAALSDGSTYDRFFCAKCCSSVEVHGTAGPRAG
jgi:hypothetical protein